MATVALEELPKKTRNMFEKGASALERNNLDYAIDIFTTLVEIEPEFLQARQFLRAAEIKKLKQKKGGGLSRKMAVLTGVGDIMATKSEMKKDPQKAVIKAEKLLRKDPLSKTFLNLHARAAMAADMPEVAIHSLGTAREHYPQDNDVLKRLAKLYEEIGHTEKAKDCFEQLMKRDPDNPEYIKAYKDAAARDTMQTGGWDDAKDYRDLIKDKEKAQRLEQTSKAVKTKKDVHDLISETELKIKREPENVNYKRALADLYAKDDRYDDAMEILNDAQKLTGGGDPQIDRAITAIKTAHFDKQIAELEEAGDKEGAEKKREEKEEFIFQNTEDRMKRYPNDLQIKHEYGVLLYERGRMTEAIQQFQQSQRNPQRRISSLYYMALCFKSKEQYDIAAEQLEKADSELHIMNDQKKEVLYELGEIYEAMGDTEKAAEYYKEIYSVDISYREVASKIEELYKNNKEEEEA